MQVSLKEIAELQAGYSFRSGIEPVEGGGIPVVQIKDVDPSGGGSIRFTDLTKTVLRDFRPEHLVRAGDVLVTTRGASRRAGIVEDNAPKAIFVAQIIALRLRRGAADQIVPAYLAWYLNQPPAQQYLEETSGGSYIQNITKESLGHLSLTIPPLKTQQKIVELYQLSVQESRLTDEIRSKREQLIQTILIRMATGRIEKK